MFIFLISYPLLGAGIKYIDNAFDEKTFNKKFALILAPFIGVLWAYTMIIDQVSATILLAVILGVFIKGKIDNQAHILGLFVILALIMISGIQLLILPLLMLVAAAILDEVGNDVIEYGQKIHDEKKFHEKHLLLFFVS